MKLTDKEFATIGPVIRAVTEAESKRLFKTDRNDYERSLLVYGEIWSAVRRALYDTGISLHRLAGIDPTDIILEQMKKDGYQPLNAPPL